MFEATLTAAAPTSEAFVSGPYSAIADDAFNTAFINGTFDGGTVTLEASPIDPSSNNFVADDWFTVPEISITEKGMIQPGIKAAFFRWKLSGAGGSAVVKIRTMTTSDESIHEI